MDKYQKFAELISDEAKAKEILSESIEETQANLKKYDLDFSVEELEEMSRRMTVFASDDELSAEALDDVAGGSAFLGAAFGPLAISVCVGVMKKWLKRR